MFGSAQRLRRLSALLLLSVQVAPRVSLALDNGMGKRPPMASILKSPPYSELEVHSGNDL